MWTNISSGSVGNLLSRLGSPPLNELRKQVYSNVLVIIIVEANGKSSISRLFVYVTLHSNKYMHLVSHLERVFYNVLMEQYHLAKVHFGFIVERNW